MKRAPYIDLTMGRVSPFLKPLKQINKNCGRTDKKQPHPPAHPRPRFYCYRSRMSKRMTMRMKIDGYDFILFALEIGYK